MQHCKAAPLGQALKNAAALLGIDTMQCCNAAHQRDTVVLRQSDAETKTTPQCMHATLQSRDNAMLCQRECWANAMLGQCCTSLMLKCCANAVLQCCPNVMLQRRTSSS